MGQTTRHLLDSYLGRDQGGATARSPEGPSIITSRTSAAVGAAIAPGASDRCRPSTGSTARGSSLAGSAAGDVAPHAPVTVGRSLGQTRRGCSLHSPAATPHGQESAYQSYWVSSTGSAEDAAASPAARSYAAAASCSRWMSIDCWRRSNDPRALPAAIAYRSLSESTAFNRRLITLVWSGPSSSHPLRSPAPPPAGDVPVAADPARDQSEAPASAACLPDAVAGAVRGFSETLGCITPLVSTTAVGDGRGSAPSLPARRPQRRRPRERRPRRRAGWPRWPVRGGDRRLTWTWWPLEVKNDFHIGGVCGPIGRPGRGRTGPPNPPSTWGDGTSVNAQAHCRAVDRRFEFEFEGEHRRGRSTSAGCCESRSCAPGLPCCDEAWSVLVATRTECRPGTRPGSCGALRATRAPGVGAAGLSELVQTCVAGEPQGGGRCGHDLVQKTVVSTYNKG